jgi:AraC-like DNA-binding protein
MQVSTFSLAQSVLRDFRYFESSDLDDTCERITNVLQAHRLLPGKCSRTIRSHMDFLQLSGLGFGTIKYSNEMCVDVTGLADYHVVIFCPSGRGTIATRSAPIEIGGRRGFASNAGQGFRASFSADCEQFILRIDRKALKAHTGESFLSLRPDVDLDRSDLAPFTRLVQALFADRATLDLVRGNPRIAGEYEQLLLGLFLEGHPHRTAGTIAARGIAPAAIRKAERYIHEHFAEPVTLLDIAREAGVPTRTLLDHFRRFRNTSPIRLLHDVRLERARSLLLRQSSDRTVSEIAVQSGFGHLGRFAKEYFVRFGEYPSQSAARVRRWRSNSIADMLRAGSGAA